MPRDFKVTIVHICVVGSPKHIQQSMRFVQSYQENKAGYPHESVVVCNGGSADRNIQAMFAPLERLNFYKHDNSGYDIGAFQAVSRLRADSDLIVFFSASTFFKGNGWLARMVESYAKHGQTLYGVMGHTGDPGVGVYPHIRTTGFWIPPVLFNQYPIRVTLARQRYPFEHGRECLTNWVFSIGLTPWVVTWDGEYTKRDWGTIPDGYRHGNESGLLCGDRLNLPPFWPK